MKKKILRSTLLLGMVLTLLLGCTGVVFADQTEPIRVGWHVDYTTGSRLDDSSFDAEAIDRELGAMQPGDRIIFTIALNNQKGVGTRWYMENEVMQSMERLATDTGAYAYRLTYNDTVIYDSDVVGGEEDDGSSAQGMTPATNGLENYFELGSIAGGGNGTVTLEIELEGESQGNSYQNAEARLRFHFAVEETGETTPTVTPVPTTAPGVTTAPTITPSAGTGAVGTIVRTGDESKNLLYSVLAGVAGLVLLILAIVAVKRRKREQEGSEE